MAEMSTKEKNKFNQQQRAQSFLGSQSVRKAHFRNARRQPRLNSEELWEFTEGAGFDYKPVELAVPTKFIRENILESNSTGITQSRQNATDALKYLLHNAGDWPPWIPVGQNTNKTTPSNTKAMTWYFRCKHQQQGCGTRINVKVPLNESTEETSVIKASFHGGGPSNAWNHCIHPAFRFQGEISNHAQTNFDWDNKPIDIWENDMDQRVESQSERLLFCNSDGHFKNVEQVRNAHKKHVGRSMERKLGTGGKLSKIFHNLLDQGRQSKLDHFDYLKSIGMEETEEWCDLGFYQFNEYVRDFAVGLWSTFTTDELTEISNAFEDGICIDDMSNLTKRVLGQRLCHCIAFVRSPAGRMPLTVFEFITASWKSRIYQLMLTAFMLFAERKKPLQIKCLNMDWCRKLMSGTCRVVNRMELRTYLDITFDIATGATLRDSLRFLIYGCAGHAQKSIARHYRKQPKMRMLAGRYFRRVRKTKLYDEWLRLVSFMKYLCENEEILVESHTFAVELIEPKERISLKKKDMDKWDYECCTAIGRAQPADRAQNLNPDFDPDEEKYPDQPSTQDESPPNWEEEEKKMEA